MTRSQLMRPLRQALSRPLAQHSPAAFLGPAATRSNATQVDLPKAEEKTEDENKSPWLINEEAPDRSVRIPRAVQALYLQPLRREAQYGVPTCDLQLRSYSIPNLEFFCDFALRAAYFLHLPAFGPVPLPKITERWTVPRSHFIYKKSQENFERITRRRLIQIKDGHPESVQIWLAFLQKHSYYGIGMKANVWEYSDLGVSKQMEANAASLQSMVQAKLEEHMSTHHTLGTVEKVKELLASEKFRKTGYQQTNIIREMERIGTKGSVIEDRGGPETFHVDNPKFPRPKNNY